MLQIRTFSYEASGGFTDLTGTLVNLLSKIIPFNTKVEKS